MRSVINARPQIHPMPLTAVRWLIALAALTAITLSGPAWAAPPPPNPTPTPTPTPTPATMQEFETAMQQSLADMATAPGFQMYCPIWIPATSNPLGQTIFAHFEIGETEDGILIGSEGSVLVGWILHESEWLASAQIVNGFTPPLITRILKAVKLPSDSKLWVSGPYKPWIKRYTDSGIPTTPTAAEAWHDERMNEVLSPAGGTMTSLWGEFGKLTTVTSTSLGGQAVRWNLADGEYDAMIKTDDAGRIDTVKKYSTVNGVTTAVVSCEVTGYSAQIQLAPYASDPIVPIKTIGPVAWRMWSAHRGVALGKGIRAAVKAVGKLTPASIRGHAYIVLSKEDLLSTWQVTDIAKGARISVSDPLGGEVRRCITVKKGKLRSARC